MVYAYYVFHKLRRFPREFFELSIQEKAVVAAFIEEHQRRERIEQARQRQASHSRPSRRSRRRR